MNPASVINRKYLLLLSIIISIAKTEYCKSQVIHHSVDYNESINIARVSDNKINVFIFIKADFKSVLTIRLWNNLNTLEALGLVDFDLFNIHEFEITNTDSLPVCRLNKSIVLNGFDLHPSFSYDPYCIIVETGKGYEEYVRSKPEIQSGKNVSVVTNSDGKKSQFIYFDDDRIFIDFLKKKISSSNDSMLIASINQLNQQQKIDSAESLKLRNTKITNRSLSFDYQQPILVSINNSNGENITHDYDYDRGLSFSLDYMTIPKNNRIGWGLSIDINEMNYDLNPNDIVDTLPWEYGSTYPSFIRAENIKERISTTDIGISSFVTIKYEKNNSKWFLLFCPGIKFSTVLSADYLLNGDFSYGRDTIFSLPTNFTQTKQQLKINILIFDRNFKYNQKKATRKKTAKTITRIKVKN